MSTPSVRTIPLPILGAECCIDPQLAELPDATDVGNGIFFVSGKTIEVRFPGIATYRIEQGRSLTVRPEAGVDDDTALFYLKAAPFGLLVLQRGELPLHASAVVPSVGGGAVLIAGQPGAGKSTTAGLLVRRSWEVLNDDICRIVFDGDAPIVCPGFQSLKLGEEAISLLQLDGSDLPRTPSPRNKSFWHLEGRSEPAPVAAMFFLENPRGAFVPARRLAGMELLEHLYRHTIRQVLVKPLGFQEPHFRGIAGFAKGVPCYRIEGNQSCTPDVLAEHLERVVSE